MNPFSPSKRWILKFLKTPLIYLTLSCLLSLIMIFHSSMHNPVTLSMILLLVHNHILNLILSLKILLNSLLLLLLWGVLDLPNYLYIFMITTVISKPIQLLPRSLALLLIHFRITFYMIDCLPLIDPLFLMFPLLMNLKPFNKLYNLITGKMLCRMNLMFWNLIIYRPSLLYLKELSL